jgi:hypothetical protein
LTAAIMEQTSAVMMSTFDAIAPNMFVGFSQRRLHWLIKMASGPKGAPWYWDSQSPMDRL